MFCVNVVAHHDSVEFSIIAKNFKFIDSLRVGRHVDFGVHLEMTALEPEEIVLTICSNVGELDELFIVNDCA